MTKTKKKTDSPSSPKKNSATASYLDMNSGPLDIVKHRWLYLILSALFLIPGLVFMVIMTMDTGSPIRLGIDFTGGTIMEYGFEKKLTQEDLPTIRTIFDEKGYTNSVVQLQEPRLGLNEDTIKLGAKPNEALPAAANETETSEVISTSSETLPSNTIASVVSIRSKQLKGEDGSIIQQKLADTFGQMPTLLQKNSIGPTLASELLSSGVMALLLAYLLIVGYLTYRFQFDYAVCAIIALVHDTLFVFGAFAILGYFFHTEIDSLFVTAILTVIGFSVHDTIVVFDRLRENSRILYSKKLPFGTIANISVNQTLARSINTSVTTLMPLFALYFFGGETTRDFVLAAILGIIVGTYSSISIASLVLAWWRGGQSPLTSSAAATA